MSRLCVKNLPKYVNEDRLREFFSQKGVVTDAKVMRTKDGKSRQFAFVGFRSEKDAEEALKYFDNSYMDTSKITCEVARKIGDPNMPRPWSRYSLKEDDPSGEHNKDGISIGDPTSRSSVNEARNSEGSVVNDPKLHEFLQVMQPRVKSKLWANDTMGALDTIGQDGKADEKELQLPKVGKKQSAQTKVQVTDKISRETELKNRTSSSLPHKLSTENVKMEQPDENRGDDLLTDMDYFKSKIKKNWSDSESDDESSKSQSDIDTNENSKRQTDDDTNNEDSKSQTDIDTDNEDSSGQLIDTDAKVPLIERQMNTGNIDIGVKKDPSLEDSNGENVDNENSISPVSEKKQVLDTGRLFIRNLPYTTTEDELEELFSQFGDISHAHLVVDKNTKRSKGIGYVLFALPECAARALEELDNSIFQGRLLHVMPAKPQNNEKLESGHAIGMEKKSLKQIREDNRKASEASGDTRAWNSLFMRSDTVVENIARKNGISKSELLDREADDLAVRIALGETHVIAETKKALSRAGVNFVALDEYASSGKNEKIKRSSNVILVKNLPYSSCEGDLASMFGKFGSLEKIILPPTKALALVIFLEAAEARSAFKGLAYKRYKDAPLYLEWAPENILCPPTLAIEEQKDAVDENNVNKVLLEQTMEGIPEDEIDPDRVESRSVFVKNLNFKTSDESLKQHFSDSMKNGAIKSVKVKKHIKNGKNVSMGFGFIEFDSLETATNVCRDLQGTILDGHALILQLCHGKRDGQIPKKDGKDKSSTKLIVRNVAFEATEKDLRQLFSPFGQIKSLRLPVKFGSHRGFAFVEYVTKQEAQNALQALSNTHLYGRHLVIERAKEGESLEELRERTAAQFVDEHSGFQKLSKKRKQKTLLDEGTVKFSRILD
ncbi:multiple RNA-binding domain-containing protein 1 [Typha angustifolia]|uniref:multiple RNA-binding domain-containing protein 1 n=1 Tax=Typha angustifolia TaxID=59011 RepID=UPI003C2E85BA